MQTEHILEHRTYSNIRFPYSDTGVLVNACEYSSLKIFYTKDRANERGVSHNSSGTEDMHREKIRIHRIYVLRTPEVIHIQVF